MNRRMKTIENFVLRKQSGDKLPSERIATLSFNKVSHSYNLIRLKQEWIETPNKNPLSCVTSIPPMVQLYCHDLSRNISTTSISWDTERESYKVLAPQPLAVVWRMDTENSNSGTIRCFPNLQQEQLRDSVSIYPSNFTVIMLPSDQPVGVVHEQLIQVRGCTATHVATSPAMARWMLILVIVCMSKVALDYWQHVCSQRQKLSHKVAREQRMVVVQRVTREKILRRRQQQLDDERIKLQRHQRMMNEIDRIHQLVMCVGTMALGVPIYTHENKRLSDAAIQNDDGSTSVITDYELFEDQGGVWDN